MMKILTLVFSCILLAPVAANSDDSSIDSNAELVAAKRLIDKKRYALAISKLEQLAKADENNADVWNLLGFASRNDGQLEKSAVAYSRALNIDPGHKGALEYQGELLIATGDLEGARGNLEKLAELCPAGCEEHDDLQAAIQETN